MYIANFKNKDNINIKHGHQEHHVEQKEVKIKSSNPLIWYYCVSKITE